MERPRVNPERQPGDLRFVDASTLISTKEQIVAAGLAERTQLGGAEVLALVGDDVLVGRTARGVLGRAAAQQVEGAEMTALELGVTEPRK